MKRYITRHGQVMDYRDKSLSHLYPPGDILLSELGQEQARLLGIRLREWDLADGSSARPTDGHCIPQRLSHGKPDV